MGDAIMAFWNAPLDDPEHARTPARRAGDAARWTRSTPSSAEEAEAAGTDVLPSQIGIGINTGHCVVGNMGSDLRFDYSVLGDAVNLASRLEGQSKTYGVRIILGATTAAAVAGRFALLELDRIRVKGKREAEVVSTLLGDDARARRRRTSGPSHEAHGRCSPAYRARDWAGASSQARHLPRARRGFASHGPLRPLCRADRGLCPPRPRRRGWDAIHVAETK